MSSKERSQMLLPTSQPQPGLPFHTPEMQSILKLKSKFEKNVEQVVNVIEQLSFNKMPQKCLAHNNNFTLYCEYDQKPLCASCVYQNQTHRLHKILPLVNCTPEITRDCSKLEKEVNLIMDNVIGLVRHVNDGISRMEKEMPGLVARIEGSYRTLHQFLVQREKEHLHELKYFKEKMKYQHGALSAELNKISLFINDRLEKYRSKNSEDVLLTKRFVYDALKGTARIVGQELNVNENNQPKLNFAVFHEVEQFIRGKMPRLFAREIKKSSSLVMNRSAHNLNSSKSRSREHKSPVHHTTAVLKQAFTKQHETVKKSSTPNKISPISKFERSVSANKSSLKPSGQASKIAHKSPPPIKKVTPPKERDRSNNNSINKSSSKKPLSNNPQSRSKSKSPSAIRR